MGGFKKFLLRGNLIDLAVAVVVGVAFNSMVQALIKDLITPLISAVGKQPNFENLKFTIGSSLFRYGDFINTVLSFLVIATVVYYLLVLPATRLAAMTTRSQAAVERACPECLSQIPIAATRCKFCTAQVEPVSVTAEDGQPSLSERLRPIWRPRSR